MQVIDSKSLVLLRQEQSEVASPASAGKSFDGFTARLAAAEAFDPDAPRLFVGFGKTVFGLTADGSLAYAKKFDDDGDEIAGAGEIVTSKARGWVVPAIGTGVYERTVEGSVPTNKMIGDVRVPAGVVLIVGAASTAKSPFAHALAAHGDDPYAVVRYGEPLAGYSLDVDEMSRDIGLAMLNYKDIVLDSIKDVLAFAAGGAMSSGIQRGAFPILSDLSALAAERGCTVYVPLNPSNPDPKVVDMLIEAARSNVACVVVGEPTAVPGAVEWNFFTRRGEGLLRDLQTLTSHFAPNELVMTLDHKAAPGSKKLRSPSHQVTTDSPAAGSAVDVEMQAAFRRMKQGLKTNG